MSPKNASYRLPIITNNFQEARQFIVDLFETQFLADILTRYSGLVSQAAEASGMSTDEIHHLLRKHKIDPGKFRP